MRPATLTIMNHVVRGLVAVILATAPWAACHAAAPSAAITPSYAQVLPAQAVHFATSLPGPVVWQVNFVTGGAPATGTIDAAGNFIASRTAASPAAVTITAAQLGTSGLQASATLTLLSQAQTGRVWYVATTGRDTNPGTQAAPWATLQRAANLAGAGDTVWVGGGVYSALVNFTRSGTATAPILFSSAPGATAIIDGTGLATPGGQAGLFTLANISHVIVQGFEFRNYTSASRARVPVGIFINGAGDGVQIINTHIHAITTTAPTTATLCASDALGLAVYGSSVAAPITNLVISGNEIDHLHTGCSESLTLNGNVQNFLVTANDVHDTDNIGIDAIGFERTAKNPLVDQARDGIIRGNLVRNITSLGNPDYGAQYAADGIYVDGGTRIVIEQNRISNVDLGIELASEHKGRLTSYVIARNNLVTNDTSNGISIGGYGAARGGTDHCSILNNTLVGNDRQSTGSGEFQMQFHATNTVFANNIVAGLPGRLLVHNATLNAVLPVALDHNLYFSTDGAALAPFQWNAKHQKGFAAFKTASGQDSASVFADPMWVNATAGEYTPQAGAPALALAVGGNLGADLNGTPLPQTGPISAGAIQP